MNSQLLSQIAHWKDDSMDEAAELMCCFARACENEEDHHPLSGISHTQILQALENPECWPRSWASRRGKKRKEQLLARLKIKMKTPTRLGHR